MDVLEGRLWPGEKAVIIGGSASALAVIDRKYPSVAVIGGRFADRPSDEEVIELASRIEKEGASTVILALGSPKQEYLGRSLLAHVTARYIGVGGAVEVAGEEIPPPRSFVSSLGLEWLQRTWHDPRRFLPRLAQAATVLPVLWFEAAERRGSRAIAALRRLRRGIEAADGPSEQ
jgi:exopolysaccharide biosynthesis WecB/TagA/CpsF family protein